MTQLSRRNFLTATGAAGLLGLTGTMASLAPNAFAANTSGYKALVCVYLDGGMDQADTILPCDETSYNALKDLRSGLYGTYNVGNGQSSRDLENINLLTPTNSADFGSRKFGLPQELSPITDMFNAGNAAIIGNVGPLIEPTTRQSFETPGNKLPKRLFSHNDQRSTWMSQGTEGTMYGWGGKFADILAEADATQNKQFSTISTDGNNVFLAGESIRQFSAPVGGASNYNYLTRKWYLSSGSQSDKAREILKEHFASLGQSTSNLYMQDLMGYNKLSVDNLDAFLPAIEKAAPIQTVFPNTKLAKQLRTVAETISIQSELNVHRQVFYVRLGGFDTHDSQARKLPELHTELAQAISTFYAALSEIGMFDNVTLFTASDFGRTLIDNGDGTDHGWGGHQFVVGGAVNGNRIYGTLPDYDLEATYYTKKRGRLIPSVSVDQYAATLGAWFGLSPAELQTIFPNLGNFDNNNLGFV